MKFFAAFVFSFIVTVFSALDIHAQDNLPGNATVNAVTNQIAEVPPIEKGPEPVIAINATTPPPVEVTTVPVNQEMPPDNRVTVEPVVMPPVKTAVPNEHSPFNRMKFLAGRWEGAGKNGPGDKQDKIVVVYDVTAGGNAVMERIFPGTSQEMVTMYYEEKGRLTLTHYCLIGTRSLMAIKPFAAENGANQNNIFDFELASSPSLDPTIDTHMHSLKISFVDENHINEEWEMFEAGKPSGKYSFILARIPQSKS